MPTETAAGRWGTRAAALTRAALGASRRARLGEALLAGGRAALGPILAALRRLWLEVAGLFFALFALVGALAAWREYQMWQAGRMGPGRFWLALVFSALFAWFGASSFWRAWKKS